MRDRINQLRAFEGRRVSLALAGDSRIDDCVVVAACGPDESIWVFSNGTDRFVPLSEVVDWWEAPRPGEPHHLSRRSRRPYRPLVTPAPNAAGSSLQAGQDPLDGETVRVAGPGC